MINPIALSCFLGVWASLYLVDAFLRSNSATSAFYSSQLLRWGLSINILQAKWYTCRFNRLFQKWAQIDWLPWRHWFNLGIVFGLIAMVSSVALLSLLAYNTLMQKPVEQQVLTPVMPGVNLPMSQLGFYLLTLLVCGIVHEIGHAVAAVKERTRVNGFGIFIFGVYPGAFVDLNSPDLQCLSPIRQLRIYCAGVWHNFVVVLLGLALLKVMPVFLSPGYNVGKGVGVVYLRENSVVTGNRGLYLGDSITKLNACPVQHLSEWYSCLEDNRAHRVGYCMTLTSLRQMDLSASMQNKNSVSNIDCCINQSSTHICFVYKSKLLSQGQSACLPARAVTNRRQTCHLPSDCYHPNVESGCVIPSLDNNTSLIRIEHSRRPPILFLGDVRDLFYSVGVSEYVPKWSFLPVSLPYILDTFAKYVISLSGALALLNVVPCYALDGQWMLGAWIEIAFHRVIPDAKHRCTLFRILLLGGTVLLFVNLGLALWFLFVS